MLREAGEPGVSFRGFVPDGELARYYAAADVFAFPTRSDPWGLVLNEALAAGLPVVVSRAAGAAQDLVDECGNGHLHDAGHPAGIATAILRILSDPTAPERMGRRSREIIEAHSPQRMADGMAEAILLACGRPRAR